MDQKLLIKRIKESGADVSATKEWLKKLDRVKKLSVTVSAKYRAAWNSLREVERICMRLEELLMADSTAGLDENGNLPGLKNSPNRKETIALAKELKKQRNRFDHLFVISPSDTQFHLVYDTVLKMGLGYTGEEGEQLIFQSEVENLLDLMRDCFTRRQPDMFAYTYYCLEHGDEMLKGLPPEEALGKIERVCRREFSDVMVGILIDSLRENEQEAREIVSGACRV